MTMFTRLSVLATLAGVLAVLATPSPMPLESRAAVDNIVYVTSVDKHWSVFLLPLSAIATKDTFS